MPVQSSQGRRRPLVPRVDELPAGVPAPARPAPQRDATGRFQAGAGTTELARAGGLAAGEARQLGQLLGLWEVPEGHSFAPYARLAREWRDAHIAQLAATVGGGRIGPGPASVISSAAMQLAASRLLYDVGADVGEAKLLLDASKLADASRANLLSAHELAAKEAKARPRDPMEAQRALEAAFGRKDPK